MENINAEEEEEEFTYRDKEDPNKENHRGKKEKDSWKETYQLTQNI